MRFIRHRSLCVTSLATWCPTPWSPRCRRARAPAAGRAPRSSALPPRGARSAPGPRRCICRPHPRVRAKPAGAASGRKGLGSASSSVQQHPFTSREGTRCGPARQELRWWQAQLQHPAPTLAVLLSHRPRPARKEHVGDQPQGARSLRTPEAQAIVKRYVPQLRRHALSQGSGETASRGK